MDKKLFYRAEKKPSLFLRIAASLAAVVITVWINTVLPDTVFGNTLIKSLIVMVLAILGNWFGYWHNVKKYNDFCEKARMIKENGEKVYGEIYKFKIEGGIRKYNDEPRTKECYYALVKGIHNGDEFTFTTPEIIFNHEKLRSKNVTVYILGSEYYADDFDI